MAALALHLAPLLVQSMDKKVVKSEIAPVLKTVQEHTDNFIAQDTRLTTLELAVHDMGPTRELRRRVPSAHTAPTTISTLAAST